MNRLPFMFLVAWGVASPGLPFPSQSTDTQSDTKPKTAGTAAKKKDAEKKEAEKKDAPKPEKKVYTNDDLKKAKGDSVLFLGPAAVTQPLSGLGDNSTGGDEQFWRGRVQSARKAIEDSEAKVREAEARVVPTRTDVNPTEGVMSPTRQMAMDAERQKVQDELVAAKAAVVAAKLALENLEEEARRKSVPPGWLR